jgi:hypothetical protein|tara:strand:+ start:566 stop:721 length:156 start_codon:yes stop_codon:yes gene_type:complete
MLELSLKQRKELIDYMARRPYAEVYIMMSMLMSLKPIKEEKKDDKNKKDLS